MACNTFESEFGNDLLSLELNRLEHHADSMKSFNLPDDVFEAGEKKPQKKAGGAKGATGKKRGPTEVFESSPYAASNMRRKRLSFSQAVDL